MANRHISFDDEVYTQLVELHRVLKNKRFSETVNFVAKTGLDVLQTKKPIKGE